jgi:hypothetical protein
MLSLDWLRWRKKGTTLQAPQPAAPEPLYERERPMTGFFATLSPEQRAKMHARRGQKEENLGGEAHRTAHA